GVKPLFYSIDSHRLLFGSEIKAILASGEVDFSADPASLHQFLLWQCIPSPGTAFREIKKLPPASVLICNESEDVRIQKYWSLDYSQPIHTEAPELSKQVRNLVQEATEIRLVADVPLGLFLSGGVDSACVLAAARKVRSDNVQTFSVAFGHKEFDE